MRFLGDYQYEKLTSWWNHCKNIGEFDEFNENGEIGENGENGENKRR